MLLPKNIDERIRKRFDELIPEAEALIERMQSDDKAWQARNRNVITSSEIHSQQAKAEELRTKATSLIRLLLGNSERSDQTVTEIATNSKDSHGIRRILGLMVGLKNDYENEMLTDLTEMIEANIASEYMDQAEHLLGEGISGQYDHVPAAVLAGAVLEDALRRLCQRQTPPIDTLKPNGDKKTLDPLIADLQKANVFNKAKADQLRSWAKTRNSAAHGEFSEFNRNDVEAMIAGIRNFIADYL